MVDHPVYTRNDGTQFTGLRDHTGATPLMTDRKYDGIAAELAKPENRAGAKVVEDMVKAEAEAKKNSKPFSYDKFLSGSPNGAEGRAFLAKMQNEYSAEAGNIADVAADKRKPPEQQAGRQRAVSIEGRPTLPQNVAAAERHAAPVSMEEKKYPKTTPAAPAGTPTPAAHASTPDKPSVSAPRSASFAKGIVSKAVTGAVGLVAAGMVSAKDGQSMQHHAAGTVDAMLPTNLRGEKTLCQQFGEAATSVASAGAGIGVGLLATPATTPIGGLAAGFATQELVGQAGSKLTQMVCGR